MSISKRHALAPWGWGLLTAVLVACQASGGAGEDGLERVHGELEIRIVDHFDGTSEERFLLRPEGGGRPLRLELTERPDLEPGAELAVTGVRGPGGFRVARFERLTNRRPEDLREQALVGATPLPKRRLAFVLVDLGSGVNITVEEARRKAFGLAPGDQSMKQAIQEYSFGRQELEGEVIGPLKTTMQGCDEDGVAERLRPQLPPGFDNVVWYLGRRVGACGWAGVAPLGRLNRITGELWVNGTASCAVATHEFGHNLGLDHAARVRCSGGQPLADVLQGNCQFSEYGDSSDVMGDGCNHVSGYSKSYLTWFEKCNGVLARESGTFTLFPVERACNGIQVLQVPMRRERMAGSLVLRNYYLELRAPIGLDSRLAPQVQVRIGTSLPATGSGRKTFVLDMKPATMGIDGLLAGEMFQDPAGGVRFRVEAIDANQATVKVEIDSPTSPGPPTCLDGTTLAPPGPQSCGASGDPPAGSPPAPATDAGPSSPPLNPSDGGVVDARGGGDPTVGAPGGAGGGNGGPTPGTGGAAGPSPQGRGGSSGSAGGSGAPAPPAQGGPASSGCSCSLLERSGGPGPGAVLVLLAGLAVGLRRRARRP